MSLSEDGLTGLQRRTRQEDEAAERIANDNTLDDPSKIDALAQARHWFLGDTTVVDAYLAGKLSDAEAVTKIADPIDEAYSSANNGRQLYRSEMSARSQRQYWSPEEALKRWGQEEDFPKPGPETDHLPTAEGQLWELWYSVLHAAKRIPWNEEPGQHKLLDLVNALKGRPDPPPPAGQTVALKKDWIWESGSVWSSLLMLGPSAREVWNDSCGCGSGWLVPEQNAWINVNAFVARLTASGTADFFTYGIWALREALEEKPGTTQGSHRRAPTLTRQRLHLTVAAVWILIAGDSMYRQYVSDVGGSEVLEVNVDKRENELPWYESNETNVSRWDFWRRRFEKESANSKLPDEVRELAARAGKLVGSFGQK